MLLFINKRSVVIFQEIFPNYVVVKKKMYIFCSNLQVSRKLLHCVDLVFPLQKNAYPYVVSSDELMIPPDSSGIKCINGFYLFVISIPTYLR